MLIGFLLYQCLVIPRASFIFHCYNRISTDGTVPTLGKLYAIFSKRNLLLLLLKLVDNIRYDIIGKLRSRNPMDKYRHSGLSYQRHTGWRNSLEVFLFTLKFINPLLQWITFLYYNRNGNRIKPA